MPDVLAASSKLRFTRFHFSFDMRRTMRCTDATASCSTGLPKGTSSTFMVCLFRRFRDNGKMIQDKCRYILRPVNVE